MRKSGGDKRPYLKPVLRVELSQDNITLRIVLAVVLLAVAIVAIGYGLNAALTVEPGWETVETTAETPTWSQDFVLRYYFDGENPTELKRQITRAYTEASEFGFRLFSPETMEYGFYNVGYLNDHPNEDVQVLPDLYPALEQAAASRSRHVFLAPAMAEYASLFSCTDDATASSLDPGKNPEEIAWHAELAGYVRDPEHIRLEIKGEGKVRLVVSQAYLDFAEKYEIDTLFDFGASHHAFLADFLAEKLSVQGFTNGYLASFDGFTRNLDTRGTSYDLNLFRRNGTDICRPAKLRYSGPMSIVALRDYPLSEKDRRRCYVYEDGTIVSAYLNPETCLSAAEMSDLVLYDPSLSCGQLALKALDLVVSGTIQPEALDGVNAIWYEGDTIRYTDHENPPELVTDTVQYNLKEA